MGRPATKPKRFKDGFYIEVRNKGAGMGMKIHFETLREMQEAAAMYGNSKEVIILGEHRKDRWLSEDAENQAPKTRGPKPAAAKPETGAAKEKAPKATATKKAAAPKQKPVAATVAKKAAKPAAKAKAAKKK